MRANAISGHHQPQHCQFPIRQRFVSEMLRQTNCHLRRNKLSSRVNPPDYFDHFLRRHGLEQVRSCTGGQGSLDLSVTIKGR